MRYAEVSAAGDVVRTYTQLPKSYRNISNFFALNPERLKDLSWSGNDDVMFYEYVEDRPPTEAGMVASGPIYTVDHAAGKVIGVFTNVAAPPPALPVVPESISARQIRMWLVSRGYSLAAVEAAIESIDDATQRELVRIEWEYAPYVERTHPVVMSVAASLEMTAEDVDQAFIEASLL
jgi:hypothetical protein